MKAKDWIAEALRRSRSYAIAYSRWIDKDGHGTAKDVDEAYAALESHLRAPVEAADQGAPDAGYEEQRALIEAEFSARDWPVSPIAAARCGWEAHRHWAALAATRQPAPDWEEFTAALGDGTRAMAEGIIGERERCARLVENYPHLFGDKTKAEIAAAIRAAPGGARHD